jgi:hypothetical protein
MASLNERRGVPRGHIKLTCDDPAATLLLLLGDTPPRIAAGVGGWQITGRPRQVGMTTWEGVEPFQLELAVMLDGWSARRSVEPTLRALVAIARGDDESPPGIVQIQGIPTPADDWVLEGMEFGDALLRSGDGHRVRQPLTLTLREYVPPSYLHLRKGALKGLGKTRLVTARKGDTPAKVATRQDCNWREIRDLNPTLVRKANQQLKPGTKLRCPTAQRKDRRSRRPSSRARGK